MEGPYKRINGIIDLQIKKETTRIKIEFLRWLYSTIYELRSIFPMDMDSSFGKVLDPQKCLLLMVPWEA